MSEGPFSEASMAYFGNGWSPIPLPANAKAPPPAEWTGYIAPYPSGADVHEWAANGKGSGNIGLRLPDGVIGIDVDDYGNKRGGETLAEAERRLGPLPPTYSSSARGSGGSGIRLYRVRNLRRMWADVVGPDVEVIHYGHRYMVVAPSIHPGLGVPYRWYSPAGLASGMPILDLLPYIGDLWEHDLDRGPIEDRAAKASLTPQSAISALADYPEGEPCPVLLRLVERAKGELASATSRHDTVRSIVAAAVRAGEMGHTGSRPALVQIHDIWVGALQFGEKRVPDPGEFERMVVGAVGIVTSNPTDPADIGCCGSRLGEVASFDPGGMDAFWQAREALTVIRQMSQARMVAPWAVLAVCLARVITVIPPQVCLPASVGSKASLNLFVALVGESGMGKGAAEAVAAEALVLDTDIYRATIGSGEGIGHLYAHREKGQLVRDRSAVLFTVPEVDNLTALGTRQGSTLMPQLRIAWMGEALGFSYADPAKRLPIDEHTYRMGLVLGVQPGRAGPLLDDTDGGTPQRMLFASVVDRQMPAELPAEPVPYHWERPDGIWPAAMGTTYIKVCPEIREAVVVNRRLQVAGSLEAIAGHSMLNRIKVATALAILDGRLSVESSDWQLSSVVMAVSDGTRAGVRRHLDQKVADSNHARGRAEGERSLAADEVTTAAKVARVGQRVLRKLAAATEPLTYNDIKMLVASRDRDALREAVEALVTAGSIRATSREGTDTYEAASK